MWFWGNPPIATQYPSHNGKNPQCVRGPCNVQLRIQKITIRLNPNQPCKGSLNFSAGILFVFTLVVMRQVYTERRKWATRRFPYWVGYTCTVAFSTFSNSDNMLLGWSFKVWSKKASVYTCVRVMIWSARVRSGKRLGWSDGPSVKLWWLAPWMTTQ